MYFFDNNYSLPTLRQHMAFCSMLLKIQYLMIQYTTIIPYLDVRTNKKTQIFYTNVRYHFCKHLQ